MSVLLFFLLLLKYYFKNIVTERMGEERGKKERREIFHLLVHVPIRHFGHLLLLSQAVSRGYLGSGVAQTLQ